MRLTGSNGGDTTDDAAHTSSSPVTRRWRRGAEGRDTGYWTERGRESPKCENGRVRLRTDPWTTEVYLEALWLGRDVHTADRLTDTLTDLYCMLTWEAGRAAERTGYVCVCHLTIVISCQLVAAYAVISNSRD